MSIKIHIINVKEKLKAWYKRKVIHTKIYYRETKFEIHMFIKYDIIRAWRVQAGMTVRQEINPRMFVYDTEVLADTISFTRFDKIDSMRLFMRSVRVDTNGYKSYVTKEMERKSILNLYLRDGWYDFDKARSMTLSLYREWSRFDDYMRYLKDLVGDRNYDNDLVRKKYNDMWGIHREIRTLMYQMTGNTGLILVGVKD